MMIEIHLCLLFYLFRAPIDIIDVKASPMAVGNQPAIVQGFAN